VDDTQVEGWAYPPFPPLKGRPAKGWFFRDQRGEPMMILSLHSPSRVLQRFFATPLQHIESYSVGGGSRWTIDESPVYAAFKSDPDTHRVGWDGWCGHLVRDLDSMGGTKKENVVICLESPRIKEAVAEYIRTNIPKFHANPELLYDIMAYELMYMCYCDRSQHAFREWAGRKHGTIEAANKVWSTSYPDFADVVPPPVKNSRPLPGTNRALWYDWTRFNQDRFTDYLLWTRSEIRKLDATVPLAAGGSSSMLAGRTGTTGIDEERIVNEVDDVIIHEGGGSTLGVDLQLAFAETSKPLADPEMSLAGVENLLPHFLHGKSVAQIYHWPAQPANEFYSNNRSSLAHSWSYSLADVDEALRVALDVRRLNKEIAAFVETPADVAILYSQTSTLQLPPEMLTWHATPYLAELHTTYVASQFLDTRVTFVTERQALKGHLDRYKSVLVPAVRNLPEKVVEAIWTYAEKGGHVVIVPESLLGDEYNHAKNYLARIGIAIQRTERPKPSTDGQMVQGYDQSFAQDVTFTGVAATKLSGDFPLESRGVRQIIAAGPNAEVRFRYPDGQPAIIRVPLGTGAVNYVASSLEPRGYARLLDLLFTEAKVNRPVRVRADSKWQIESRFAQSGKRRLLYISNFNSKPAALTLDAGAATIRSLHELREDRAVVGNQVTVPGRQTTIYELF
jgi:beta-galactosidase GanA